MKRRDEGDQEQIAKLPPKDARTKLGNVPAAQRADDEGRGETGTRTDRRVQERG